jgi:excisionase family DNA binding protein
MDAQKQTESTTAAVLLTPQQLAERLAVPATWIREKCRERARVRDEDPLPFLRLGKYVRFNWSEVEAWLGRQGA